MAPRKGTRPPNKLPARVERQIAIAYASERSSRRVAKRFGVARGTVLRIAHERGITVPAWGLSSEASELVLKAYLSGKSGPEVAAEYNTTPTTVYSHLSRSGKRIRSLSEYDQEEECNHDYFDQIDRPEKAYWLGMLLADGCISMQHEVILSLCARDIDLVLAFKSALGSRSQITIAKQVKKSIRGGKEFESTSAAVRVRSRRLCAALACYGILPGKTLNPRMVKGIPPRFERDFWRGAVDGDGWVVFSKRPNGSLQFIVGFTGGMPVVKAFQRFCRKHCPTRAQIRPNHSVYRFVVTDWCAFDIARLMYGNASVFLHRKFRSYEKAQDHFSTRSSRRLRNW
jgi:hypothetical protein